MPNATSTPAQRTVHDRGRHPVRGAHQRRRRSSRWLQAMALTAAALAAACSLPVQGRATGAVDPTEDPSPRAGLAPLPEGWPGRRPPPASQRPAVGTAPLWGVPAFEAPAAAHCSGPQRLREVPGHHGQRVPGHDDRLERPGEYEARPLSKATTGVGAATTMPAPAAPAAPAAAPLQPLRQQPPSEIVTAGMVDDNADFGEYLNFRHRWGHLGTRDRDVGERYRIEVRDSAGRPAADAEVALSWPGAARAVRFARTDSAGGLWLHPRAIVAPWELGQLSRLEVQVRHGDDVARATLQRGQKHAVQLRMGGVAAKPARQPLDVVFLVDATGSMADEIAKLRDSIRSIADRVQGLPQRPDLCWGLVAYRDRGDEFLTRSHDLTHDLSAFHGHLSRLQAGGGGDYPEALNEALNETVHRVSWRGDGTARLVVLIADAPPHLDYGQPYYDQDSAAALARGIKLHAVGASGLNRQGEAVFRQMAQTTGGKFVFLTYQDARRPGAAPGSQTSHDVRGYSVETLDDLIVKLVADELAGGARR